MNILQLVFNFSFWEDFGNILICNIRQTKKKEEFFTFTADLSYLYIRT